MEKDEGADKFYLTKGEYDKLQQLLQQPAGASTAAPKPGKGSLIGGVHTHQLSTYEVLLPQVGVVGVEDAAHQQLHDRTIHALRWLRMADPSSRLRGFGRSSPDAAARTSCPGPNQSTPR